MDRHYGHRDDDGPASPVVLRQPPHGLSAAAIALLPDAVGVLAALYDADGHVVDFEWLLANPAAEALIAPGRPDHLAGARLRDGGIDRRCPGLFAGLAAAMDGPAVCTLTAHTATADGRRRWRLSASPLPGGVCATLVDLGPDTAPPMPDASGSGAEPANRAKNAFLTHMSHELRTPLNAVLGFSQLLLSEVFGPLGNPRYHSYAADIRDSGAHLLTLIDDVLDLSRLEAGAPTLSDPALSNEGIDIAALSAQVLTTLCDRARENEVTLSADVADDLPMLLGDPQAIRQSLLNLLSNAVKFTPPGGKAMLTVTLMPDGGIGIMAADTGIGIPAADLGRMLEPFEQADNGHALAVGRTGLGLGLPIAKRLVELHGGRLELTSEPGVGTSAVLIFPASRSLPRGLCPPLPLSPRSTR